MSDIKDLLQQFSQKFNQLLPAFFPMPDGPEKRVVEAMQYSIMNGGKRLRPFLLTETAALFNVKPEISMQTAIALELLHTYSLIHDDLPAMDDDELRRGQPTCHCRFDEATAILAGDGLLTYAFEVLSRNNHDLSTEIRLKLINLLARAAGAFDGMVSGQQLDLYSENWSGEYDPVMLVTRTEAMKTGCLIRFACEAGAILGGATEAERQALTDYARHIGIAFQIADDILDVEGDPALMGKTLQKDAVQGKITFVSLYGLDKAKEMARDFINQARQALQIFGEKAENLTDLAEFIITRNR